MTTPTHSDDDPLDGFYVPLPPTHRRDPIKAALRVLADPKIPDEHAEKNHNCGECWACIEGTIALIGFARKQRHDTQVNGRGGDDR